jgi:hypothetical protein
MQSLIPMSHHKLCTMFGIVVSVSSIVPECVRMCQNVSECVRMCQNVSECVRMCQNVSECVRMCDEKI